MDFQSAAEMGPPLPENLDDAIEEILRLRKAVTAANFKTAQIAEKAELTKRSLAGQVKHYRELLGLE